MIMVEQEQGLTSSTKMYHIASFICISIISLPSSSFYVPTRLLFLVYFTDILYSLFTYWQETLCSCVQGSVIILLALHIFSLQSPLKPGAYWV